MLALRSLYEPQLSRELGSRALRAKRSACAALVALALSLISGALSAQVNMEKERGGAQREGIKLSLDGSLNLIRGNMSLTQLGLGGRLTWKREAHLALLTGSSAYGEREEQAFLNQSFWHARWTTMLTSHAGGELFAQLQEDAFRSLNLRQLYGGGARLMLVDAEHSQLALGLGYMFERESYQTGEGGQSAVELNHRSTNYLSLSYQLPSNPSVSLINSAYFQPNLKALGDYRALNELSLEVKLSDRLRLVESLSTLYDSAPPPGVKPIDLKSMTTLRLEL